MPPSSIDTRRTCGADCSISLTPTSVEPVKDTLRRAGCLNSGPVVAPLREAVMTFNTPAGSPHSSRIWASASIDSGVCCAGLTTIVQPAAIAGPILRVPIAMGKFHGVMNRHGPTGWRIVSSRPAPLGAVAKRPSIRTASSENQRRNSDA